jgi:hypothetical protein
LNVNSVARGEKTRWTVAVVAGAAVMASLLLLFRLPQPPIALPVAGIKAEPKPPVQIASAGAADAVLVEETVLRDLRPLFLPTKFNASLPEPRREPGRTFLDDEHLKLGIADQDVTTGREFATASTGGTAADPVTAVAHELPGAGLIGLGRDDRAVKPLVSRVGFVEVFDSGTGHQVFGELLPAAADTSSDKPWEPMELLATVDAAGLTTPLIVTSSSGVEEVDAHLRKFLARTFRIGERLPPGIYRIVVGP